MNHITATIITHNEQDNIERCLKSLEGVADEIVVVDSFSDDRTAEICREHGCHVTQRRFTGYGIQKQYATSVASHKFILSIDADEVLSDELRDSIKETKTRGFEHRVYAFEVVNNYFGHRVYHGHDGRQRPIRLFNKRYAQWNLNDVAESVTFPDSLRPVTLDGQLMHYRCADRDEFNRKESQQSVLRASVLAAGNRTISPLTPYMKAFGAWVNALIIKRGFMDGKTGRIIAARRSKSAFDAYQRARKIRHNQQ